MLFFVERLRELTRLLFPVCCEACDDLLHGSERILCTQCLITLPRVQEDGVLANELKQKFIQLPEVKGVLALFSYTKKGRVQRLLHRLKYRGNEEIGVFLGELIANEFLGKGIFPKEIEAILSVPLHKRKKKERGYNQAEAIARGISEVANLPLLANSITKTRYTTSQTWKNKEERLRDVEGVFQVPNRLSVCRVILVDDVVTTGATLSAIVKELVGAGVSEVYVLTVSAATYT